jgi:iron complex outermembrane recepter protein
VTTTNIFNEGTKFMRYYSIARYLGGSAALAICLFPAAVFAQVQAAAQDAAAGQNTEPLAGTPATQVVVVSGIRRGIESAIATKKNSDQIMEAVSAEDLGKLPDSSIADSIARLPGLAAQRIDGRPSAISIRGH